MNPNKDKVIAMRADNVPPMKIAHTLSVPVSTVHSWIKKARANGTVFPALPSQRADEDQALLAKENSIVVPIRLHSLLVRSAEQSGFTPSELARRLLEDALLKGVSTHV
jgi:hypothetical protein